MEESYTNNAAVPADTAPSKATTVEGTVKSFDPHKKFGFITQEDGKEVFVHQEAIVDQAGIAAGDRVSFEVTEGPKGLRAASVRKL